MTANRIRVTPNRRCNARFWIDRDRCVVCSTNTAPRTPSLLRIGTAALTTTASPWAAVGADWPADHSAPRPQVTRTGGSGPPAGRRQHPRHEAVRRGSGPERTRNPRLVRALNGASASRRPALGNHQSLVVGHPNPRRQVSPKPAPGRAADLPTMRPRIRRGTDDRWPGPAACDSRRNAVTGGRAATAWQAQFQRVAVVAFLPLPIAWFRLGATGRLLLSASAAAPRPARGLWLDAICLRVPLASVNARSIESPFSP